MIIWKTKSKESSYRSLTIQKCSWWMSAPINIKFNYYESNHFGFEFMPVGFNKYGSGWSLRFLAIKLVWVG